MKFRHLCAVFSLCVVGTVMAVPATAQTSGKPCSDVRFIGVRGSGENPSNDPGTDYNMGSLVGRVYEKVIARAQSGQSVSGYGIEYAAASVESIWTKAGAFFGNESARYYSSVREGVGKLTSAIDDEVSRCPSQKLVLAGYSQGAHVILDTLAARFPDSWKSHIAAVVTFGNPKFNSRIRPSFGSFGYGVNGSLGARPPEQTDYLSTNRLLLDFCRSKDPVCQRGNLNASYHAQSAYVSDYGEIAAGFAANRLGWPKRSAGGKLDLAFVVDTTGSMGSSIASVQGQVKSIADSLRASSVDFRLALVEYKDLGDPFVARTVRAFSPDVDSFKAGVDTLVASGGGDLPESVYGGLMEAIANNAWRDGVKKGIVLLGDAPPHDPDLAYGYTRQTVLDAAFALDPASIYGVAVGSDPATISAFKRLADGSDGAMFNPASATDVGPAVLAASESAAAAPLALISGPEATRPGVAVGFSAAGSDAADGDLIDFAWDFDSDGTIDASGPDARTVEHTFDVEGVFRVLLRVTDAAGRQATTFVPIAVTADAATVPRAPSGVSAAPNAKGDEILASWVPPGDIGGSAPSGYLVTATRVGGDGSPEALVLVDAAGTSVSIPGLELGQRYVVSVAGTNAVGTGPETLSDEVLMSPSTSEGDRMDISIGRNRFTGPVGDGVNVSKQAGAVVGVSAVGRPGGGASPRIDLRLRRILGRLYAGTIRVDGEPTNVAGPVIAFVRSISDDSVSGRGVVLARRSPPLALRFELLDRG
ncbi:MAG: cutinase family protein [Microthrixaceae bacterium]|nr:cutinase family protein [Microthrixaceae bacterium]HNK16451.1 cutinase family protein [Nitrospira sp.]MCB9374503.1 cutinase family protein [Microthrixaceae bacterium]MCB9399776.1 cutinase family protein [Microthrixaceae bacterium]MCO5307557.1 cutinase family protein [Microthrixaceae bacterium]